MAIPAGVCRCSILGSVAGGEIFDTSFWVLGGADSLETLQDMVNAMASLIKVNIVNTLELIESDTTYDSLRAYAYTSGGPHAEYVAEASLGPLAGTNTGHYDPYQTCAVLSLRTPEVGRSKRGRMYLPASGATLGAGHQFDSSLIDAVNGEWAGNFTAINEIVLDGGGNPVVSVVSQTLSEANPVSSTRMTTVPEIQRRRANKIAAAHTANASV